ncbi:Uncharacterised protein [uncultured archaeon]|nr:Uncharacterised protein [uncultured archaeon]
MVKSLGEKIAIAALSSFLTVGSIQALTPENLSQVKTAFRADNSSFLILQDNSITSVGTKKDRIVFDEKKKQWVSDDGKVMSAKFQAEAEKVLKFAGEKAKKGIKFVNFFDYTTPKETDCFNLWSDGTASFGPYQIGNEGVWFYDSNKNGKFDKGEPYMKGAFNSKVNTNIVADLSELATLRQKKADSEKEKAEYEKRIANLNSTIADYMDKSVPTNGMESTLTEYANKIKELTAENARLETEYAGKIKALEEKYSKGLEGAVTGQKAIQKDAVPQGKSLDVAVAETQTNANAESDEVKPYSLPPSNLPLILDSVEGLGEIVSEGQDIRDENKVAREYAKQHPTPKIVAVNSIQSETKEIPTSLSIILQPVSDSHFAQKGASVGMRYDFGMFGVGLLGNVEFSPDSVLETYVGNISATTGRHAEGKTTEKQKLSLGAGLEGKLGFAIAGVGVNYNQGVRQSDEKIMKGTNTLSSNTSSVPYNNVSWNAYAGAEVQVSSGFSLGAVAGYDGNSGFFGGLRGTVKVQLPSISVSSNQNVQPSVNNVHEDSKEIGRN